MSQSRGDLLELFHRVGDRMRRQLAEALAGHDLNLHLYIMLRQMRVPLPMKEVAERACLDASTVTGLTDRLEALGLVERRPSLADRRVKELVLTEVAEALMARIESELAEVRLFGELDDRDVSRLTKLLERLIPSD